MNYRELGRTGLMVSEIGLGCEGFVDHDGELVEPLLNAAEQAGVNCLDLYSPDPEMRSRLGRALKGRRNRFILQAHGQLSVPPQISVPFAVFRIRKMRFAVLQVFSNQFK